MRGYVDTDWGQLHYRSSGAGVDAGGPVVAMYHESPRSSVAYEPVMAPLGEHVTAFAFDTPGFGLSDSAPAGAPMSEYGRILIQALDRLGVDRFVPVGMKTGSALVTEIATQLLGSGRIDRAILYALEEPDPVVSEHWAANWAPDLPVTADGSILTYLWNKNIGLYGTDSPRDLLACVADTISNLERYNSIYPTVFRAHMTTWVNNLALIDAGIDITVFEPPSGQMTPDDPIEFTHVPGTTVVKMPVSGQFPSRATNEFVSAVLDVVAKPLPANP
jgi:pimeloyl-ACP methyl ester carboxylesterase